MSHHGLHHVTAIAGAARRNFDFYTRSLGLRFVKKTVNFDDPGTYHFYYGDETGSPGTILTFFPWEHVAPGPRRRRPDLRDGVPGACRGDRLLDPSFVEKGVPHEHLEKRFGESVLVFKDPDGMRLSLVGVAGAEAEPGWSAGDVPAEHAIRGFNGVTLLLDDGARTGAILTDVLGFRETARMAPSCALRPTRRAVPWSTFALPPGSFPAAWAAAPFTTSPSGRPTTPRRPRWRDAWPRTTASARRSSGTATTSDRSISGSPAASCSRSPPTIPDSPSTKAPRTSVATSSCRSSSSRGGSRSRPCCRNSA